MKKCLLIVPFLVMNVLSCAAPLFPTLTHVERYAETLPEYVESTTDWLNPDFSSFHKKRMPGAMRRFLHYLGLRRQPWNPQGFKRLLRSLVKKRELDGQIGDFIQAYNAKPGSQFFIWTDLFGAFHSLVRNLVELRTRGVINDDFKITKPDCFLLFNGNVIDHSPYVLETLTLVMRLLEVNPKQVVYIRGYHEDNQEWHSYGLARQLKIRASGLSSEIIPLNSLVTQFFYTLPLALFLPTITEEAINVVLIVNNEYSVSGFDVQQFAGFLGVKEDEQFRSFKIANKWTGKKPVQIKVLISGEDRSITYHQTEGLTAIGMQREALRWLNFSSPTSRNRRLYEFFHDAFIEMVTAKDLDNWTVMLYNQDVRKLFGFKKAATYNLLTGQRVQEGVPVKKELQPLETKEEKKKLREDISKEPQEEKSSQKEKIKKEVQTMTTKDIVVGSTMDLSKSASLVGKPVKEGLELAFKQVSQAGGVGQFLPRIIMYDDEYTPSKTRTLVKDFVDKSTIDILLNPIGSPTTESYLDLIKDGKVLVLFPYTGAPIFRKPELKSIAHMRIGYVDEGRVLAEYALDELQAKKVAIFYQNDSFGLGALQGATEVFDKRGIKVLRVPYDRNDVDFDQQANIIEQEDPDTIFFFAVSPSAKSLIRRLGVSFLRGRNLIGMSVYDESFEQFLKSKGLKFIMIRMVPDPLASNLEIVREYRKVAKGANHVLNFNSLESFINANVFFDILKRITPPVTKEKMIKEIEAIKHYNFKGIELDFDPKSRELVRTLWIDTGEGPWIKKEIRSSSVEKAGVDETKNGAQKKVVPQEMVAEKKEKESFQKELSVKDGEKKPLKVGSIVDLSKGVKQQGKVVKEGIELRLREDPDSTRKLIAPVVIVDDEYTPHKTVQEVKQFLNKGISVLLAPVGSPTLAAYLDLVKAGKALVLFPITGAPLFRQKDLKYIAHIRPSYKKEGKILTEYALDTLRSKKAVMFYQDDAFGKGLLDGAQEVLKERGIADWLAVPYQRNDVNFTKQVTAIKKYDPDTILFFSTTTAAMGLIRQLGIQEVSAKNMLANSDFGEESFLKFIHKKGLNIIYLNVVPNPKESNLAIVQQFRDAAEKQHVLLDTFSLESYIATDFLIDILSKIQGAVTKEKLIDAIEKVKEYDYKGLRFNFNPENRTLSSSFWIYTGSPEWQKIEVK